MSSSDKSRGNDDFCPICNSEFRALKDNNRNKIKSKFCIQCKPPNGICPECGQYLRTKTAQQCACGVSWHCTVSGATPERTPLKKSYFLMEEMYYYDVQKYLEGWGLNDSTEEVTLLKTLVTADSIEAFNNAADDLLKAVKRLPEGARNTIEETLHSILVIDSAALISDMLTNVADVLAACGQKGIDALIDIINRPGSKVWTTRASVKGLRQSTSSNAVDCISKVLLETKYGDIFDAACDTLAEMPTPKAVEPLLQGFEKCLAEADARGRHNMWYCSNWMLTKDLVNALTNKLSQMPSLVSTSHLRTISKHGGQISCPQQDGHYINQEVVDLEKMRVAAQNELNRRS